MNYVCWWNQQMNKLVWDDPKLPDDSGKVPKPNRLDGSLIPGCDIISLIDKEPVRWSSASCVLLNKLKKLLSYVCFTYD